jgi:hypothetical protein
VSRPERADPLVGTERLIVDGSNLLHAIGRGKGGPAPAATLIGRLRGVIPGPIRVELIFDGPPDPGLRGERIASGLTVRHSGRYTADSLIDRLVADAIGTGGTAEAAYAAGSAMLIVTDDIDLGHRVRRRGARTASARWLVGRLERGVLVAPSSGTGRAPGGPRHPAAGRSSGAGRPPAPGRDVAPGAADPDDDPPRWNPGRGATKKTGNPKRGH